MTKLIKLTELLREDEYDKVRIFIQLEACNGNKHGVKRKDAGKIIQLFDTMLDLTKGPVPSSDYSDKKVYQKAFGKTDTTPFYPLGKAFKSILSNYFSWQGLQKYHPKIKDLLRSDFLHRAGHHPTKAPKTNSLDLKKLDDWLSGYAHLARLTLDYQIIRTIDRGNRDAFIQNLNSQIFDLKTFYLFKHLWTLNQLFNLTARTKTHTLTQFDHELSLCRNGYYDQEDPRIVFLANMLPHWTDAPDREAFQKLVDDFTGDNLLAGNKPLNFPEKFREPTCHLLINLAHRAWERGHESFMEIKLELNLWSIDQFSHKEFQIKVLFTSFLSYLMACPSPLESGPSYGAQRLRKRLIMEIKNDPDLPHIQVLERAISRTPSHQLMPSIPETLIKGYENLAQLDAGNLASLCEAITLLGLGVNLHLAAKKFRRYQYKGSIKAFRLQSSFYFIMAYFDGMYKDHPDFFMEDPKSENPQKGVSKEAAALNSEYLGDISRLVRNLRYRMDQKRGGMIGQKDASPFYNAARLLDHIHTVYFRKGRIKEKGLAKLETALMKNEPVFSRDWFVIKHKKLVDGKY